MRVPIIPLFAGKPPHPFVPLGRRPAGARSEGQGRPQAGATRKPFTVASTLAGWRQSGVGSAVALAAALLSGGAAPVAATAQDLPAARSAAAHPYAGHVADAARRFGIPEAWIWAVMRVESGGNSRAVSRAGAMGLMQIMPATWADLRARYGLGADPFDVRDNIMAGAAYLRWLKGKYAFPALFAAYNAGPQRVDDLLAHGTALPAETQAYVAGITRILGGSGGADGSSILAVNLTRPDGSPVKVDPVAVLSIREAFPGEYPANVQAVLRFDRRSQAVTEDVASVTRAVREHGGHI